jgi:hypothetical protein
LDADAGKGGQVKYTRYPVSEAVECRGPGPYMVYDDHWWVVVDGFLLFYRGESPQCNSSHDIAKHIAAGRALEFLKRVFIPQKFDGEGRLTPSIDEKWRNDRGHNHQGDPMKEFEAYAVGICAASVCTSLPVAKAAARLNAECPTGVGPWRISSEDFKGGQPNPCPCDRAPATHKHYLFNC